MGKESLTILIVVVIIAAIYFTPTIVAFRREHANKWPIFIINLVFGTTLIGWIGALIWAMHAVHTSESGNNGGESGLNLFVNDVKTVRLANTDNASDYISKLNQLQVLLDKGTITEEEFKNLKRRELGM
jgi:hypothetical protein